MITKIEIENYRGYQNCFIYDLSATKQYGFNKELIKSGVVNKALIYGPNGAGKSTLLLAFMELSAILTDSNREIVPDNIYFYAGSDNKIARFKFHFKFGDTKIVYEWGKSGWDKISYEKLFVNDVHVLEYSHTDAAHRFCSLEGADFGIASIQLADNQSFVKFLKVNTLQDENSPISMLVNFARGMLYFKNLIHGNQYLGFTNGVDSLDSRIIANNKLDDFASFLKKQGLNYNLIPLRDLSGQMMIGVKFNNRVVPFDSIASSGTHTLELIYYWSMQFEKATMVLIDEFDAYYHSDVAANLALMLNKVGNAQILLTTHNTRLFSNEFTRPDCCFVHDGKSIKPVYMLSDREFRKGDNLEKMYRDNDFSVNRHSV
ncbi:MAG: AAA family ATPase [Bacilli bacterium]|nr:AAA family ATPase [Bacilli bacterium]